MVNIDETNGCDRSASFLHRTDPKYVWLLKSFVTEDFPESL